MKTFKQKFLMAPEGDPPAAGAGEPTPPAEPTPAAPPAPKPEEHWQAQHATSEAEKFVIKKQLEELKSKYESTQQQIDGFKADPIAAYRSFGGDLDRLTQTMLTDGSPDPDQQITQLGSLVKQLTERLDDRDKAEKERKAKADKDGYFYGHAEQVQKIIEGEEFGPANDLLKFSHEAFGTDTMQGLIASIRPKWETEHQTTGRQMTPSDSAKMVLQESIEMVKRLAGSATLRKLLAEHDKLTPPAVPPSTDPPPRSVQNSLEGPGKGPGPDPATMSDNDYREWATKEYRNRTGQ